MRHLIIVCSFSVFLSVFSFLSAQESLEDKPKAETKITIPDGSLEELYEFVAKYDKELQNQMRLGQLLPQQTPSMVAVQEACAKILADPTISNEFRLWALKKGAQAQIMLAYADPSKYYGKLLAAVDDYEEQEGCKNIVKTVENHVLKLGILIVTAPKDPENPKPLKLNFNVFVDRLLFYLETYPEPESRLLTTQLITAVKATPPIQRDRMMSVIAERLTPYYLQSKDARDRDLGRELQGTGRLLSLPGKPMPLEGVLPSGELFDSQTLKGKVVLVQFWEPTCIHCRAAMPLFAEFLELYEKKGFEVVGVCTQGGAKAVQDFIKRTPLPNANRITWPILVDELAPKAGLTRLAEYFNITETPVVVLIDRSGNVVRVNPLPSALPLEIEQVLYPKTVDETVDDE